LTDKAVALLAQRCNKSLLEVNVSQCPKITDRCIPYITHFCLNMESFLLKRTSVTNQGILNLTKGCQKLHSLNIDGCNAISDDAIIALTNFKLLHILDVSWCMRVTLSALLHLVKISTQLHTLILWGCDFTDEQLRDLGKARPADTGPSLDILRRYK